MQDHVVLPTHRFGHQSGCGERSRGVGTAKFHVFSVRVFLDMSQEPYIRKVIEFLGQTGAWVGWGGLGGLGGDGVGDGAGDGWDGDGVGAGGGVWDGGGGTLICTNLH